MNTFEQIAYLVATDPAFRQAFNANPDEAIASCELTLNDKEAATVSSLRRLIAASPQALKTMLLSSNESAYWGGVPPLMAESW